MKIILDVNVWISALLWGGLPAKILYLSRQNKVEILISDSILYELKNTLERDKFKKRIDIQGLTVEEMVIITERFCRKCPDSSITINIPELRDIKDNHVLGAALFSEAEALITGDQDLLVLNNIFSVSIVNPSNFLHIYFPES